MLEKGWGSMLILEGVGLWVGVTGDKEVEIILVWLNGRVDSKCYRRSRACR